MGWVLPDGLEQATSIATRPTSFPVRLPENGRMEGIGVRGHLASFCRNAAGIEEVMGHLASFCRNAAGIEEVMGHLAGSMHIPA